MVLEHLDIIDDIGARKSAGFVDAFADRLLFQTAEEGLRNSAVPTVSAATHARHSAVPTSEAPPVITALLCAVIQVENNVA